MCELWHSSPSLIERTVARIVQDTWTKREELNNLSSQMISDRICYRTLRHMEHANRKPVRSLLVCCQQEKTYPVRTGRQKLDSPMLWCSYVAGVLSRTITSQIKLSICGTKLRASRQLDPQQSDISHVGRAIHQSGYQIPSITF